jgi:protein O-mannosyl-transferase
MTGARRALLVLVPLGAYAWGLGNGFVWDDHRVIERGRLIESLRNVPLLFTHDTLYNSDGGWYEAHASVDTYRPLTMTTFFVERAVFGLRPLPYHLDSVLIHVGCVLLLFVVGRRLALSESASLLGALLFAAHPALGEAVHWVNGRSDPLFMLALLGAVALWLGGATLWPALLVLLATLCKETAFLLLPPLLLLTPLRRGRGWVRAALPLAVGGGLGLLARVLALHQLKASSGWPHLRHALGRLPEVWLDALRSLLLPAPSMPPTLSERYASVSIAASLAGGLLVLLLGAAAVWAWRRRRALPAWALLSFLLATAPIAMLSHGTGWNGWGRYLYPAAPAVCLALAALLVDDLLPRLRPAVQALAGWSGAALIALLTVTTGLHARDWRDDEAFARACIRDHAGDSFGYIALAQAEMDRHPQVALSAALRAASISPRDARNWSFAANALMQLGRRDEALRAAEQALALDPADVNGRYLRAIARIAERREEEAARLLLGVLVDSPHQAGPWQTLGEAVRRFGRGSIFATTVERLCAAPSCAPIRSRVSAALDQPGSR